MKKLIIAEKPSVARDLANVLGRVPKKGDIYENDEYVISSAVGHLVELYMPDDIDKKLRAWSLKTLPIIPEKFQLKPIEKTKAKFNELKKLLRRKDIEFVINACDAGREGELIFYYIYTLSKSKLPVKRLWMVSMTPAAIRKAFEELRDEEEMQPLVDAARCRSESDWLIGINGTRALTKRMFGMQNVATVGRVQTPTLTLVVEREQAIRAFKPRDYWRIKGHFKISEGEYEGIYQKPAQKRRLSARSRRADLGQGSRRSYSRRVGKRPGHCHRREKTDPSGLSPPLRFDDSPAGSERPLQFSCWQNASRRSSSV